jgi:hypothetical protein
MVAIFPNSLFISDTDIDIVNHAVIDASYAQIWLEDFDRALEGTLTQLPVHIDYKLWADSYFSMRQSPEARAATKWHLKQFENFETHRKAIFPPPFERATWDPVLEVGEEDGVQHSFEASGLVNLRKEYRNISVHIPLKAALALLNTQKTGHTHALFANLEAARTTFPFVTKSMEMLEQFEATDVSGPTIESVINLIEIRPEERVHEFLQRMQSHQTNLTKYASAPWREIMSALGKSGDMIPAVTQAQIFNWVPGMGTTGTDPNSNFKIINAVVRPQVGFAVNAGLGGPEANTMFLHVRGDAFDRAGLMALATDLEKVLGWMTEEKHWNAPVSGFVECL